MFTGGLVAERTKRKNRAFVVADAVGISHFIVANSCILLGQFTEVFKGIGGNAKYPGLEFIYKYFDAPILLILGGLARSDRGDVFFTFLVAELVVVAASIFYGILAYIFIKLLFLLLE